VSSQTETSFRLGSSITAQSPIRTEVLHERRRLTISGEGYLTSTNISAPGAYLLVAEDVLFCCEVNKDGNTR
jgi:hypothetical protein